MQNHVDALKAMMPPHEVQKLDAMGVDWTKFIAIIPQLISLFGGLFGGAPKTAPIKP